MYGCKNYGAINFVPFFGPPCTIYFSSIYHFRVALYSPYCAGVPLRNCSLIHSNNIADEKAY